MPVKILVVDDSLTMRKIMEMTFAGEEAEVVAVDSGEAAVQKAQEITPDVVFADLSMQGLDGYGVSATIKNVPALANTAVIVMASQHQAYDEGKGADAGVDDHVVKPFDSQAVIDKVGDVLKRPRMIPSGDAPVAAAPAAPARPAPPAPPKKSVPKHTVAFGARPPGPPPPPTPPSAPKPPERPVLELADEPEVEIESPAAPARPSAPRAPAKPAAAAAAATSNGGAMASKLEGLGLDKTQIEGVLALSREVIEQVVWEVVPELAETIIKEEIKRLTSE